MLARKPAIGRGAGGRPRDVKTYAAEDVEALVARRAESVGVDPLWVAVESGARMTAPMAAKRFPTLTTRLIYKEERTTLPFQRHRASESLQTRGCTLPLA